MIDFSFDHKLTLSGKTFLFLDEESFSHSTSDLCSLSLCPLQNYLLLYGQIQSIS